MTGSAVSLWLVEAVNINIATFWSIRDDFIPLDALDVTQIVVVEDAKTALQDICNREIILKRSTKYFWLPDICRLAEWCYD